MGNTKLRWMVGGVVALGLSGATATTRAEDKALAPAPAQPPEVKVSIDQVPAAVKATLLKEAGDAKIGEIDKANEIGKTIYETDVTIGSNSYEIKVSEDGTLLRKDIDNEDVKLTPDQLPPAVKAALEKEAAGAAITEVVRATDDGFPTFEADVKIGAHTYDIIVSENGTLISKALDFDAEPPPPAEVKKEELNK